MRILPNPRPIHLRTLVEIDLGSTIGQLRAVPVQHDPGAPPALLLTYGADFDVDPYVEMFFFPTDTLKMAPVSVTGEILWRRDLGTGVVPGIWFCPVLAFDLDDDGVDEIYYVDNENVDHPLGLSGYRLPALDSRTGQPTGHWPWPNQGGLQRSLSHTFRNFLLGGKVEDQPVLVTAQGTYGDMYLQAWDEEMQPRWDLHIPADSPGARGSHMCPVVDLDNDASDEILWGAVEEGHIDMGWVARMGEGGRHLASAIRIGTKTCGPDGRFHQDITEFSFDALTGTPVDLPFSTYRALPVDVDGDGLDELVRGVASGSGELLDRSGAVVAELGGAVALACKVTDLPGEQLLSYYPDGIVRLWADANARDTPEALRRYRHPAYATLRRLFSTGYNLPVLGGV